MGAWSDFKELVDPYITAEDYERLPLLTLQAAITLGTDLRGYSQTYKLPDVTDIMFGIDVAMPVPHGMRLVSIDGARAVANGTSQWAARLQPSPMQVEQTDTGARIRSFGLMLGYDVFVDFSVNFTPGLCGDVMPDFLFESYSEPMQWKIAELAAVARANKATDGRLAAQHNAAAAQYRGFYQVAKNKRHAERGTGEARIGRRGASWI